MNNKSIIMLIGIVSALFVSCETERDTRRILSDMGPAFGTWEKLAMANGMETGKQPTSFENIGYTPPQNTEYLEYEDLKIGIRATLKKSLKGCETGSHWEVQMLPDQTFYRTSGLKNCTVKLSSLSGF